MLVVVSSIRSMTSPGRSPFRNTYVTVEGVAVEIPRSEQLHLVAGIPSPWVAIHKWGVESEHNNAKAQEDCHQSLADQRLRRKAQALDAVCEEVNFLAEDHNGEVKGGEIVVQEELARHEVEWEIVEEPAQNASANLVVKALERSVLVVTTASLPPNNGESLKNEIDSNGQSS